MGTLVVNISSNPNPAMSDCYIQACNILASSCNGISTISRVRVMVMVRDRCVKGLCHGMDVVYPRLSNWTCLQLAHAVDECILCHQG